jgi:hypothetical protein
MKGDICMEKLSGNHIQKARHLFEDFNFYQPVIFSIFENQYDGFIYTDDQSKLNWALLQTPFLQHIIAGKPTNDCEPILEDILFSIILNEQNEKEIVVFHNNNEWNDIMERIFKKRNGVSDSRKIFQFSYKNYNTISRLSIPNNVKIITEKSIILPFGLKETWSAKLLLNEQIISHCDAIMVGKNMAEIDIGTEEAFRGKGYATIVAMALIDKLLEDKITPCWSTWPFREESQHISQKLGFVLLPDIKAWIWLESMQKNNV